MFVFSILCYYLGRIAHQRSNITSSSRCLQILGDIQDKLSGDERTQLQYVIGVLKSKSSDLDLPDVRAENNSSKSKCAERTLMVHRMGSHKASKKVEAEDQLPAKFEVFKAFIRDPFTVEPPVFRLESYESTSPLVDALPVTASECAAEEVLQVLVVRANSWDFDVFALHEATGGYPLSVLGMSIFRTLGLDERWHIPPTVLRAWLARMEDGYERDNPYHNSTHAADVLQATFCLVVSLKLTKVLRSLELLAVVVAAIIHDLGHPGVNNEFLVNAQSYLAALYNDSAVLENHHVSNFFKVTLADDSFNILANLRKEEFQEFRELVIYFVLGTDAAQHAEILSEFMSKVKTDGFDFSDRYQRKQILRMLLHASNVSNQARTPGLASRWTEFAMSELLRQGDLEQDLGLPLSPTMDRAAGFAGVCRCQVTFIDEVVEPLFAAIREYIYWHQARCDDLMLLDLEVMFEELPGAGLPAAFSSNLSQNRATWVRRLATAGGELLRPAANWISHGAHGSCSHNPPAQQAGRRLSGSNPSSGVASPAFSISPRSSVCVLSRMGSPRAADMQARALQVLTETESGRRPGHESPPKPLLPGSVNNKIVPEISPRPERFDPRRRGSILSNPIIRRSPKPATAVSSGPSKSPPCPCPRSLPRSLSAHAAHSRSHDDLENPSSPFFAVFPQASVSSRGSANMSRPPALAPLAGSLTFHGQTSPPKGVPAPPQLISLQSDASTPNGRAAASSSDSFNKLESPSSVAARANQPVHKLESPTSLTGSSPSPSMPTTTTHFGSHPLSVTSDFNCGLVSPEANVNVESCFSSPRSKSRSVSRSVSYESLGETDNSRAGGNR